MTDIIWGNGSDVLSNDSFILKVTHRKNGNKNNYSDTEKVEIVNADLPGFPSDNSNWNSEILKEAVNEAFLKCEIIQRNEDGILLAKVSHSGVGGY